MVVKPTGLGARGWGLAALVGVAHASVKEAAKNPVPPLPEPLREPLPLYPLPPLKWWIVALGAVAIYLAWRWMRRSRPAPIARAEEPAAAAPEPKFGAWVRALEEKHLAARTFRDGCDELDRGVRRHLDAKPLTATEVGRKFTQERVGGFAIRLRDARFGRQEPEMRQFRDLCKDARNLFAKEKR